MTFHFENYSDAFVERFGNPDPNQDWGMNEKLEPIFSSDAGTRAAGFVEVNRNEWTMFEGTTSTPFPTYGGVTPNILVPNFTHAGLGRDIKIPGWPHLNGLYYAANGNVLQGAFTGEQVASGSVDLGNGNNFTPNIPAGDVTPYEIQYVSNWFRTHQITNPEDYRLSLHLSDFFIQNVSCDYDQVEYRKDDITPYKSDWPMTGNNGRNIASKEDTQGLKSVTGGDYAVNLSENISYDLDNLGFMSIDEEWTHVNNFNRGNSNFDPEDNESNPNREIKYVKSAGTEDFRCHPSWCTETDWIKSWVLVRLTWNETVKDPKSPYLGKTIPREGYYLAFDFHGEKQGQGGNQIVNQDGYYSNWIIKITPGYFTPTGQSRRIFCEDLGGSFDFDFNDAVIDVAFEETWSPTHQYIPIISVQAAGGTMPIYVEKHNNDKYELHRMLGQKEGETLAPINVSNSKTHIPAVYRGDPVSNNTPGDIKICVKNTNNGMHYQISGTKTLEGEAAKNEDERSQLELEDGQSEINLKGDTYKTKSEVAPRAFAVPTSVKWMNELTNIEKSYEDFPKWVADAKWMNTELTPNQHWYEYPVDEANCLFTSKFTPERDNPTSGGGYDAEIRWTPLTPDPSAQTAAQSVSANSWLLINKYTGVDAVKTKLNGMDDDGRVTFVVVLSSTTQYNQVDPETGKVPEANQLKGIITPADISNSQVSYNGNTFNYANMKPVNSATLVEGNHEFGENVYTYTLQFSLSKSDILNSAHTDSNNPYHDYILFYLKVGNNDLGTKGDVTVQKWYVHY